MEIERKYLIKNLPDNYREYPFHQIEQGYLCTDPVVRVRREDHIFYLTYKGRGKMIREEHNLPLTEKAYSHLLQKADGNILTKKRYLLPLNSEHQAKDGKTLTIELDIFEGKFEGLFLAEVEFDTEEEAKNFVPPDWFGRDVTFSGEYQNSKLSGMKL